MTKDEEPLDKIQIFACGPSRSQCHCNCPDHCEHVWDGPTWKSPDGLEESSTCNRCGMTRMDHDMWVLP